MAMIRQQEVELGVEVKIGIGGRSKSVVQRVDVTSLRLQYCSLRLARRCRLLADVVGLCMRVHVIIVLRCAQ